MRSSRRKFLGGAGVLVALPALGIFRPRFARSNADPPPRRLLVYFLPNGRVPANWIPPESGPEFSFPATLAPFQGLKGDLICLSELYHTSATLSAGTGDHALGTGSCLTCAPYPDGGLHGDISMDQALVKALQPATRFPSLQWGAGEPMACDFGAACSYTQSISWAGPLAPLAPIINPLTAFNQLFAGSNEGATAEAQAIRRESLKSVLDYVLTDADSLSVQLGAEDRQKLDEYFTSVRELETRLTNPAGECESGPAPADALDYPGRVQAFNDLIALAFQCNQSQVITFMLENGLSGRSHPFIGAPGGHHGLTHGAGDNPAAQLLLLETWQAQQAAALATKLKSMPDSDGSFILDNTAMLVLTDMGDGGSHDHTSLAQVIVGRCGGALNTGQSIHCGGAPLGNMYVSLLRAFGVDTTSFGVDGVAPLPGVNV
ncbi:DUF1552 domain-containing protein [Nannocystis sp.]|uniref:DUF1552 domain-containing protein n=1 Tax=Nannocystis sp. TaxID=1962667 RepID=UPI002422CD78|nr:DUF1552 domain-containing protein [Nannocystis sp.]MBK7826314.1 DUF1552 domain-containing protein [Nannocystis sp.]MBK9758172.1 DUF1552 domain-containing protein [Nannocystis sp.]